MNLKITDLIYRQNRLIPKDKCKYFIDIFENNIHNTVKEQSVKQIEGKSLFRQEDNHKILNLSKCSLNLIEIPKNVGSMMFKDIFEYCVKFSNMIPIAVYKRHSEDSLNDNI